VIGLMLLALAGQVQASPNDAAHAEAFARAAIRGVPLVFAAKPIEFRNMYDMRAALKRGPNTEAAFRSAVKGCKLGAIVPTEQGFHVSLDCPDDGAHPDGVVAYNLSFTKGLVSKVSFQVGEIRVFSGPPPSTSSN